MLKTISNFIFSMVSTVTNGLNAISGGINNLSEIGGDWVISKREQSKLSLNRDKLTLEERSDSLLVQELTRIQEENVLLEKRINKLPAHLQERILRKTGSIIKRDQNNVISFK